MVMTVSLTTTNPLYLVVVLLATVLVGVFAPRTTTAVAGVRGIATFGAILFVMSLAVASINGNYGSHILFTMPGPHLPGWIGGLRLGGPVSAEGLVAATIRGLAILCVLMAFAVFNGAVSPHRVLRTAPAALFHAGLVVTIGLTLLPASIEDLRRLREMRALRGAKSGVRQLPALVVPAVIGGLERSMRLAEAMEARGYASSPEKGRGPRLIGAVSAPLLLGAAWGWYYYESMRPYAAAAAALGLGSLAWWAWNSARERKTTRMRTEPLTAFDRAAIAASGLVMVGALAGGSAGLVDMHYNPFAGLAWPAFSPAGAVVALSCAWPACVLAVAPRFAGASRPDEAELAAGASGP
jgi:energy-coupling factor transport system permease protein